MATKSLLIAVAASCALAAAAHAQGAPDAGAKITIGIYTPTVEFGTAQARLAYVQGLAKAIEQNTGIKTEAQSYASIAALEKDKVDFAIVDGPCYAVHMGWRLLADANIGGATTRPWALYSASGTTMQDLKGKKLVYVQSGCSDAAFVDNAMLESEVDPTFFGARVGEKDLTGALATVTSYKTAQAVFAPVGSAKGLNKVFETGAVPNPAFVEVAGKLPTATADKVAAAVIGYGGGGAISGWTRPSRDPYAALASRLGKAQKYGILANPDPVRIDANAVLVDPSTLRDAATVAVRRHFVRPASGRMD
jgi:hypothetical protein